MAKGISFIPSSSGKRSRKDDRNVEYTEGEKLSRPAQAAQPEPERPMPAAKRPSGFSAWLARRKQKEGKHEEVKAAAQEPQVPESTPGDNVINVPLNDFLQGEIYQDEEADRKRRLGELARLQALRSSSRKPAAPKEVSQVDPAPAPHVEPPIAPPAPVVAPEQQKPKKEQKKKRAKKPKRPKKKRLSKKQVKRSKQPKPPAPAKSETCLPVVAVSTGGKMHEVPSTPEDAVRLDVNLIPDAVLQELRSRNRIQDLLLVAVASAVVVFAGYGIMKWYQNELNVDIQETEQQVADVERKIGSYGELQAEAVELDDELVSLQEVLGQHIYWTPFLDFVESHTLPTVYYQSLAGSSVTGSFTFSSVALDYSQIDPQARLLRQSEMVNSVTITSAAEYVSDATGGDSRNAEVTDDGGQTYVKFTMTVQFSPKLFRHARSQTGNIGPVS